MYESYVVQLLDENEWLDYRLFTKPIYLDPRDAALDYKNAIAERMPHCRFRVVHKRVEVVY